ncbi:tRNA pseudouridine(55) synthase TruB [Bartonella sp. DGB2]|uniref:tRNA pseudouridine(55) synthase TruB n=1 Tax=Bartonella sp. DGB2 TaxID=3388426 RepID=UPI00398FD3BE
MARMRKKKGRSVSGWVILDKPKGMGSTEAVAKIKWLFQAEKAGHAGTLDPLASGLLPIALGEATKTVPYVMEGTKVYHFVIAWGEERNTDDLEGNVVKTSDKRPQEAEILALLPKYCGVIWQTPPQFSAIKIAGSRAYDLAREGEVVEIPAREVEIDRLTLLGIDEGGRARFEVVCGKGTYVRSLARDLGRDLGCYGHIAELRRVEVAPFDQEDMVELNVLEAKAVPKDDENGEIPLRFRNFDALDAFLIETGAALEFVPHYSLNDEEARRVRAGNAILLRGQGGPFDEEDLWVSQKGRLVAIGVLEQGQFKPRRVFGA